ncbi:MAG: peptidoglycan DD-metalloendopeptidase family protein [Xanthomonadaceae bacterium]|nr:peptidoglycan DD-metalloendopeptidase family protein [Xanthomonadaceae bacterium]
MFVVMTVATLVSGGVAAQTSGAPNSREAQRRLEKIRRELKDVAAERRALEGRRGEASLALRRMDERLADSSRALNAAESELAREQHALQELDARRAVLRGQEGEHRRALAGLLRAAYAQGERAPLELALAQDRIADADRQLTYYGYLQRHRVQRTRALTAELAELERVERQIVDKRLALDAARAERARQQAALTRDRAAHAAELDALERRYGDRRARERALGSDAKALQTLVERLRAAAARAAAERVAAERAARAAARKNASVRTTPRPAQGKRGVETVAPPPRQTATAAPVRVGGYGWPASGSLLAGFGGRMPDGRTSSGLLIAAGLGSPVRAVADGTVVFSEWMTGYGLILIVDHGNGTLSLYAHNESLLKNAGDTVSRGDVVARVGNSGGLPQPGLYFELRRNGQPVNPAGWLGRQ